MSRPHKTIRIVSATALTGVLLLAGGVVTTAPAFAVTDPALDATDSSVSAAAAHQSVFSESFLWQTLQTKASRTASEGLFTDKHVSFMGGVPAELRPVTDYRASAAGEPGWAYTPASATPMRLQVQLTATRISDGVRVESPVRQLGIAEQEWHASAGQLPIGTFADWAWTEPLATIDNKYSWGSNLGGTDQQWSDNSQCLAVPVSHYQPPAGGGWSLGFGSDFTPTPSSLGAMNVPGLLSTDISFLDGQNFIPITAQISAFKPFFSNTLTVNFADACPNLDLTGRAWLPGGDIHTGTAQFSDSPGSGANHINWSADGTPAAGVVTSADVTATPDNNGNITFTFGKTPLDGEAGTGGVTLWAETRQGTQVRVIVHYSFTNYGGAPTASSLAYEVPLGQTTTVTESDLRTKIQYFSNASPTVDVSALPDGVTESTTAGGDRAFSYTALSAGDVKTFSFQASETQSPAGVVRSQPATVTFTAVGAGDSTPSTTPATPQLPIVSG